MYADWFYFGVDFENSATSIGADSDWQNEWRRALTTSHNTSLSITRRYDDYCYY
jgi:hypothetical protein